METNDKKQEETELSPEQKEVVEQEATPGELKAETEIKPSDAKIAELNDKYMRLYSDFENYKRRTSKERIEFSQVAAKDFFVMMLPVIDDFERAMKSVTDAKDIDAVKEGITLIYQKFTKTLFAKGLEPMESKGVVFDPEVHEAITNIPAPTDDLKGKVVDELEKGYYLNSKVIRYAKVVVGQ